jgi:hypothetical protein
MRGTHQGQQSARTAPTGRTHDCKRPLHHAPHDLLHRGGHPHMKRRELMLLPVIDYLGIGPLARIAWSAGKPLNRPERSRMAESRCV